MYSTPENVCARNREATTRRVLPLLLFAAALGGCGQQAQQAYTPPPLVVDGAMQRRQWERSVAPYPNGDTVSGYNRFPVRSNAPVGENQYGPALYDIAASAVQTVALPFTYFVIPPFSRTAYTGEQIGPTYTAMPPMRPPSNTVMVDGLEVDRDTLEVRPPRGNKDIETYRRYGPRGPGDVSSDYEPPAPASEWE